MVVKVRVNVVADVWANGHHVHVEAALTDVERKTSLLLHELTTMESACSDEAPVDLGAFRVALEKVHYQIKRLRAECERSEKS